MADRRQERQNKRKPQPAPKPQAAPKPKPEPEPQLSQPSDSKPAAPPASPSPPAKVQDGKLHSGWSLALRTKLKMLLAAEHQDFTPEAELKAAHSHAVAESVELQRCENYLKAEESRAAEAERLIGFGKLKSELDAAAQQLEEAKDLRYAALTVLDEALSMQTRVRAEDQLVKSRLEAAEKEAQRALVMHQQVDGRRQQLAAQLEEAEAAKERAIQDELHAQAQAQEAKAAAEEVAKTRREISRMGQRLANERKRYDHAVEERERLKGGLQHAIAARQSLYSQTVQQRERLRQELRDFSRMARMSIPPSDIAEMQPAKQRNASRQHSISSEPWHS